MTKWDQYFKIVDVDKSDENDFWMDIHEYQLVVIATGEVVATYRDEKYAKKQARYKFKKIANRVEKILLG